MAKRSSIAADQVDADVPAHISGERPCSVDAFPKSPKVSSIAAQRVLMYRKVDTKVPRRCGRPWKRRDGRDDPTMEAVPVSGKI